MWYMKVVALAIAAQVLVTTVVSVPVTCDYSTDSEVCDCGESMNEDDTCEFELNIEHLQTFTRYQLDNNQIEKGTAGCLWYIDGDTGKFQNHPECTVCEEISEDNKSCTKPSAVDGYTFKSFIAINGHMPGPTLIVKKDQYVVVKVINKLASESISMHWHGMHQRNSNWMDGVEHATQCGILPGASFTYVFKAEQSGTHWYHSHSGAQRTEGLFGALVVREDTNTIEKVMNEVGSFIDTPAQHTLTFLDWADKNSIDLFTLIHSGVRFFDETRSPGKDAKQPPRTYSTDLSEVGPVPYWSGLINGKGKHFLVNYKETRLSIFTVQPKTVYRFRLIGAQSLYAYRVSIDEHKLKVIATDGAFVNPRTVDYIIVHSGERFDFLLETKSQTSTQQNFMIRAKTLEAFDVIEPVPQPIVVTDADVHVAVAILHYNSDVALPNSLDYEAIDDASVEMTCTEDSPCQALNCPFRNFPPSSNINCTHIHQLTAMFPLTPATGLPNTNNANELFFNFGFEGTQSTSAINARNLKLPSVPLSQLVSDSNKLQTLRDEEFCRGLENPNKCDDNLQDSAVISPDCRCTHVHELQDNGKSVQLVISAVAPNPSSPMQINNSRFAHPVHLHGHYFHVVDIQFGEYNDKNQVIKLNEDINCGGTNLRTKPSWAPNIDGDYSQEIVNAAPLKDTILIPFGGYAVVYYTPNNPGYWFLHCHIEVHQ